jgi:hypothetical protein
MTMKSTSQLRTARASRGVWGGGPSSRQGRPVTFTALRAR